MKRPGLILSAAAAALGLGTAFTLQQGFLEAFGPNGSRLVDPFRGFGHKAGYYVRLEEAKSSMASRPRQAYEIENDRGEKLRGYYYPCGDNPTGKIAFILHGYRADHAEAAGVICQSWHDRGFDVFGCDHIASGESEGRYISFDYYESRDALKWTDFLRCRFGQDVSIVLHGFSMGAATVMKMADRLPDNVKFIVEDSGFTTGELVIKRGVDALYPALKLLNRLIAGFDLKETDVRPHLLRSRLPILFVHGRDDPLVPFSMGQELYDMYDGEKDCLFIEGLRHVETAYYALPEYEARLDKFIERYMQT